MNHASFSDSNVREEGSGAASTKDESLVLTSRTSRLGPPAMVHASGNEKATSAEPCGVLSSSKH